MAYEFQAWQSAKNKRWYWRLVDDGNTIASSGGGGGGNSWDACVMEIRAIANCFYAPTPAPHLHTTPNAPATPVVVHIEDPNASP